MREIQAVLLDFGGCIDADGIHTRTLFLEAFRQETLLKGISTDLFQDAYSHADQALIHGSLALRSGLAEMNLIMAQEMGEFLNLNQKTAQLEKAAQAVTDYQSQTLQKNRAPLGKLSKRFRMGIISNFTGNLEVVLREFEIRDFFSFVLDSFHVGVSKPNPDIFKLALEKIDLPAPQCLYVGDNPDRDIAPAKALGFQTGWIHIPEKKNECSADYNLHSLRELPSMI